MSASQASQNYVNGNGAPCQRDNNSRNTETSLSGGSGKYSRHQSTMPSKDSAVKHLLHHQVVIIKLNVNPSPNQRQESAASNISPTNMLEMIDSLRRFNLQNSKIPAFVTEAKLRCVVISIAFVCTRVTMVPGVDSNHQNIVY